MPSRRYYAHTRDGAPPSEWQPLEEHLRAVAEQAAAFAAPFESADWAGNAGWLHDLGKACTAFQSYLRRENGLDDAEYDGSGHRRVDHSSAGTALAVERWHGAVGPGVRPVRLPVPGR